MKKIFVYVNWMPYSKPMLMGILYSQIENWKERISFEYSDEWLNNNDAKGIFLDPNLKHQKGLQYILDKPKENFGVFTDASPDGWGKKLMRRRESILAKKEKREERHLFESDFLLGVHDMSRIGGLRFKEDMDGDFLSNDDKYSILPVASLEELEYASMKFEEETVGDDRKKKWIEFLFRHGSSLGGARPKASIKIEDNLHIAKFPSKEDEIDIGAWEIVAHDLARKSGIKVPDAEIRLLSPKGHTYLSKRFDRMGNKRIHFASAMTMLGRSNMEDGSYLDIAEFIIKHGADVKSDLQELWSRIVFNICVSNTDDHLRNHGFLLTPDGWRLSPAYDMNPSIYSTALSINISEHDNSLDIGLALDVAKYFYVDIKKANSIIGKIGSTVKSNWRSVARKYGIPKSEQDRLHKNFNKKH